jgi:hypothetical protein
MARRRHNTQTPRERRKLVEHFERRVQYSRQEGDLRNLLERPCSLAWVIHPLADEAEQLAELGMEPEECQSADAYWRYRDSVYFVQLYGTRYGSRRRPAGIYYCFDQHIRQDVFDVGLPRPRVTTSDFHQAFELLEQIMDSGQIERERAALTAQDSRWITREEPLAEVR